MKEYIWEEIKLIKFTAALLEIIDAIGGPKTSQHAKAKNKSFNKTKIVFWGLDNELSFCPIKFMFVIFYSMEKF